MPAQLTVRRLFRPEEVDRDLAYNAGWWDLYMAAPSADLLEVRFCADILTWGCALCCTQR
jgi:hypothetical protein